MGVKSVELNVEVFKAQDNNFLSPTTTKASKPLITVLRPVFCKKKVFLTLSYGCEMLLQGFRRASDEVEGGR